MMDVLVETTDSAQQRYHHQEWAIFSWHWRFIILNLSCSFVIINHTNNNELHTSKLFQEHLSHSHTPNSGVYLGPLCIRNLPHCT